MGYMPARVALLLIHYLIYYLYTDTRAEVARDLCERDLLSPQGVCVCACVCLCVCVLIYIYTCDRAGGDVWAAGSRCVQQCLGRVEPRAGAHSRRPGALQAHVCVGRVLRGEPPGI